MHNVCSKVSLSYTNAAPFSLNRLYRSHENGATFLPGRPQRLWTQRTMADRAYVVLSRLASSVRHNMPSLVTGVLMPVLVACAQPLFSLFAFHCPCTSPENWDYTLWALAAPFGVISVVGFAIQLSGILGTVEALTRRFGCNNCCCRCLFFVGASVVRNVTFMFAAMAWPILALLDGSYAVCGGTELLDWSRFPALANLSHLDERQRRRLLARVPCKEIKEPLPGLVTDETHDDIREEVILFLRASSQAKAWILTLAIAGDFLLMLLVTKLIFKVHSTLLKSQYERYEAQLVDEKTKELAKTLAENNVSELFSLLSRIRVAKEPGLTIPAELRYVDDGQDCSDLYSWSRTSRLGPQGRETQRGGPPRAGAQVEYTPLMTSISEESD